ncbi:MAG: inorganic diphosphatase [Myxococcota bacterium]
MMEPSVLALLEDTPEVLVELPRFSVVKRRSDGTVDFISPFPCPFNYGCIPALTSGDGDPLDALVLGPRLPRGTRLRVPVVAVFNFHDEGAADPKVICSPRGLSASDARDLRRFFALYARFKRMLSRARGGRGDVRALGFLPETAWRRA